jgi:hypothetical protein
LSGPGRRVQQMWHLLRPASPPVEAEATFPNINCFGRNENLVVIHTEAWSEERLCWRGPAAVYSFSKTAVLHRVPKALGLLKWEGKAYISRTCSPSESSYPALSCTSTSLYVFIVWCFIKHRDNFTFCNSQYQTRLYMWTSVIFQVDTRSSTGVIKNSARTHCCPPAAALWVPAVTALWRQI